MTVIGSRLPLMRVTIKSLPSAVSAIADKKRAQAFPDCIST